MTRLEYLYLPFDESVPYRVSQPFGINPAAYWSAGGHNGVDFGGLKQGIPICAALDGEVIRSDFNPDGYGRSVWIRHYDEHGNPIAVTIYGHLSKLIAIAGSEVKAHDVIGLSGGDPKDPYAGRSTGLHLHFEVRLLNEPPSDRPGERKYNARDPLPLIVGWQRERLTPIGKGLVNVARSAYVRRGADDGYKVNTADAVWSNERVWIYDERDGMLRISDTLQRWVPARYVDVVEKYDVNVWLTTRKQAGEEAHGGDTLS